jgi:hypothetical protein
MRSVVSKPSTIAGEHFSHTFRAAVSCQKRRHTLSSLDCRIFLERAAQQLLGGEDRDIKNVMNLPARRMSLSRCQAPLRRMSCPQVMTAAHGVSWGLRDNILFDDKVPPDSSRYIL